LGIATEGTEGTEKRGRDTGDEELGDAGIPRGAIMIEIAGGVDSLAGT